MTGVNLDRLRPFHFRAFRWDLLVFSKRHEARPRDLNDIDIIKIVLLVKSMKPI